MKSLYVCSILLALAMNSSPALAQQEEDLGRYEANPDGATMVKALTVAVGTTQAAIDQTYASVQGSAYCEGTPACSSGTHFYLTLDIYRPTDSFIHPAIIYVHGGAWQLTDKSSNTAFASSLAKAGFVVFVPNYRMVGSYYNSSGVAVTPGSGGAPFAGCTGGAHPGVTDTCVKYPDTCADHTTQGVGGATYPGFNSYLDYCMQKAIQLEDGSFRNLSTGVITRASPSFAHPIALQDVRQALKWVKNISPTQASHWHVDQTKPLGLIGSSAGANLTMQAATDYETALGGISLTNSLYNVIPDIAVAISPALDLAWAQVAASQTKGSTLGHGWCDQQAQDGTNEPGSTCAYDFIDKMVGVNCTLASSPPWTPVAGTDCAITTGAHPGSNSVHNRASPWWTLHTYASTIKAQGVKMYTFNGQGEFMHYIGANGNTAGHGVDMLADAKNQFGASQIQYHNCMIPYEVSADIHVGFTGCIAGNYVTTSGCGQYPFHAWPSDAACTGFDVSTANTVRGVYIRFFKDIDGLGGNFADDFPAQ